MSEIFKLFESTGTLTAHQALVFVLLVVPGFIALHVYDLQRGGERRKINEVFADVVIYSVVSDMLALVVVTCISSVVPHPAKALVSHIIAGLLFIVVPVVLAVAVFRMQLALMESGSVPDTLTTPWNRMMDTIATANFDAGVIVTFRDGRAVGARIGQSARHASANDDLLLGEVWTIGENRATLLQASPDSRGLLVTRADCQTIEFVELSSGGSALLSV